MSLKEKMQQREAQDRIQEAAANHLYKNDRNFRADRLVAAWSKNFGPLGR